MMAYKQVAAEQYEINFKNLQCKQSKYVGVKAYFLHL